MCVIAFCLFSSNAIEQNLHEKNACKIFTFEFVLSVHLFMIGIKACYVRMYNKALNYNYGGNVWNSAIIFKRGRKRCRKDNEFYLEFNGTQRTMYIIYYAKLVLSNPTVPNSLYTYSRTQLTRGLCMIFNLCILLIFKLMVKIYNFYAFARDDKIILPYSVYMQS